MGEHANDHIVTFTDFRSSENPHTLSAQAGQKFTDVAFNDTGDLLFAWAYGQKDSLYIWRYQDGVMGENLTLNLTDHGHSVAVWNLETELVDRFVGQNTARPIAGAKSLQGED